MAMILRPKIRIQNVIDSMEVIKFFKNMCIEKGLERKSGSLWL